MRTKSTGLVKRIGHGKSADIQGLSRKGHEGDTKRTATAKTISRKHHNRKKVQCRAAAIEILNNNTELWNEYGLKFDQN